MAPMTPLRHPFEYYRRPDRPSTPVAIGVVLLEAITVTAVVGWFLGKLVDGLDVSAGTARQLTDAARETLAPLFVGWVALAAIFHVFMWLGEAGGGTGRPWQWSTRRNSSRWRSSP